MPVHLNGRVCDMAAIMELAERHKLLVIEDAAQALGASFDGRLTGSFGRTGEHHLPNTEAICHEVISLPMSAETTDRDVDVTANAIRRLFSTLQNS